MNEQRASQLYRKYKKKVYSVARFFVKDNYLAEDLCHEILIKCYYNRDKFHGNCSLDTWVYRVARNHCIDFLRRNSKKNVFPIDDMESVFRVTNAAESEFMNQINREDLLTKIRQLPVIYQDVLHLYYFNQQTVREIQQVLHINESTVKTRLYRAKRKLKEIYCEKSEFLDITPATIESLLNQK